MRHLLFAAFLSSLVLESCGISIPSCTREYIRPPGVEGTPCSPASPDICRGDAGVSVRCARQANGAFQWERRSSCTMP
jgi:hypothetical protein